jgi:hypothetical protein
MGMLECLIWMEREGGMWKRPGVEMDGREEEFEAAGG